MNIYIYNMGLVNKGVELIVPPKKTEQTNSSKII